MFLLLPILTVVIFFQPAFSQSSFQYSGNTRIYLSYKDVSYETQLPPFYINWDGTQTFEYEELPFVARWNLTTANPNTRFIPNAFNVSFGANELRNRLATRMKQYDHALLQNALHQSLEKNQLANEKIALDEFFKNPEISNDVLKMNRYDSLSAIVQDKSQLEELKIPDEKQDALKRLLYRRKQLEEMNVSVVNTDSLKQSLPENYNRYNDPSLLKKELLKAGKISRLEKTGLMIEKFSAGRFSPFWGDATLRNVTVDGAEVALLPGNIYTAALAGRIYPWTNFGFPTDTLPYNRSVLAAGTGYGSVSGRHFHVHLLQFRDDFSGDLLPYPPSPKANYILAASGGGIFFNGRLQVKASLSGSQTSHNISVSSQPLVSSPEIVVPKPDDPQSWIENIIYQRKNSLYFSTGKALDGIIKFSPVKKGAELEGEVKYTDPYYQSFGSPFLPSDYYMIKGGVSQPLAAGKLRLRFNAAAYRNNLQSLLYTTSRWINYTTALQMNFKKIPRIDIIYQPVQQTSPVAYWYHFAMVQASSMYYNNFNRSLFTALYTLQLPGRSFLSHNTMLTYSYFSLMGYSLSVSSGGFFRLHDYPVVSLNIKPGYEFFRKWSNNIAFEFYGSKNSTVRQGMYYESYLKLSEKFSLGFKSGYNRLDMYNIPSQSNASSGSNEYFFITSQFLARW